MSIQLVREEPPGFGGVERVAHELSRIWETDIYFFRKSKRRDDGSGTDKNAWGQKKQWIPCLVIAKIYIPLPTKRLIRLMLSKEHIHAHIPSAEILALLVIMRLLRPKRKISIHWHAYLQAKLNDKTILIAAYQELAFLLAPAIANKIVCTSNILRCAIEKRIGKRYRQKILVLECSIGEELEKKLRTFEWRRNHNDVLRVLYIGRKANYKSVSILLAAAEGAKIRLVIKIIGIDRYDLKEFEAYKIYDDVEVYGIVTEAQKVKLLEQSDVLILPSVSSNEAFGIVQLEAMASGIPSIAFWVANSAVGWVGRVAKLNLEPKKEKLSQFIDMINEDRDFLHTLSVRSRRRYDNLFAYRKWKSKAILCYDCILNR